MQQYSYTAVAAALYVVRSVIASTAPGYYAAVKLHTMIPGSSESSPDFYGYTRISGTFSFTMVH